jgi:hypothetical protein
LRHGPQLQQVTHPSPQDPRHFGHCQVPLATASSMSSPCLFRKHIPQNESGSRPLPHPSAVHTTCVSTVFWRHQWQVTPNSLSYTLAPTENRRLAWSPSLIELKLLVRRFPEELDDLLRAAASCASSSCKPDISA